MQIMGFYDEAIMLFQSTMIKLIDVYYVDVVIREPWNISSLFIIIIGSMQTLKIRLKGKFQQEYPLVRKINPRVNKIKKQLLYNQIKVSKTF